ncbi:creatininase family protein [Pseudonocardia sp. HH130630-07]|uniref:creatininase family protein n=1 Tax=Pseudonocardia sp. HH130630-07 TaxID=1690815 RepID=UPI000814BA36|nr:creatininase family protein [Pseudonocardia sp. HH130630-07]ANY07838.1 creatinine amidohydrolase [Pseudonocardia sp. HH130630-07]
MTVRQLTELTRGRTRELAAAGAVALLPIGAVEQHGDHLPMGTDALLADAVLDAALADPDLHGPGTEWVRLPTLAVGHSPHHLFAGAVSLRPETLSAVLADVLDSLAVTGFARAVLVNGHGGNDELARLAVKAHTLGHQGTAAAALSYWSVVADTGAADAEAERPERTPGHAGWFETSLMLAVRPDLVGADRPFAAPAPPALFDDPPHPGMTTERHGEWARVGGTTDDAGDARADAGAALLRRRGAGLAAALTAFDRATRRTTTTGEGLHEC